MRLVGQTPLCVRKNGAWTTSQISDWEEGGVDEWAKALGLEQLFNFGVNEDCTVFKNSDQSQCKYIISSWASDCSLSFFSALKPKAICSKSSGCARKYPMLFGQVPGLLWNSRRIKRFTGTRGLTYAGIATLLKCALDL